MVSISDNVSAVQTDLRFSRHVQHERDFHRILVWRSGHELRFCFDGLLGAIFTAM